MGDLVEDKIHSLPEDVRVIPLTSLPNPYRPVMEHGEINKAIAALKREWLIDVLTYLGLSDAECDNYESQETSDKMKELRVEVFDTHRGEIIVKQSRAVIGEWAEPEIIVVPGKDGQGHSAHAKLKYWSVVDLAEDNN